jgi:hypothetical protein
MAVLRSMTRPRAAMYLVTAVFALSFAYDLMRMPIQRADALQDMLDVQTSSSVFETFKANLGGSGSTGGSSLLRPLKFVQIKALFELAGSHYWLVFRGFHAALMVTALLLFVRALAVRTWTEFSAATFALTMFTGLHTFVGTVREAFPINHTLEIVVCCLIALNLVRSRGGPLVDAAAAATFLAASLILESGLLVWVIIAAAWATGSRGVSSRGLAVVTALLALYLAARFFLLSVSYPGLAERSSGYLFGVLEGPELERRFGDQRLVFYAYNVAASILSVLFAEPQSGVFGFVRGVRTGDLPPYLAVAVASSTATTALIVWTAVARRGGARRDGEPRWLLLFAAVLVANATISFAYTKDEIVSLAGVLYACAAFAAARELLEWDRIWRGPALRVVLSLVLAVTATLWAFRSAGLHHILRVQAWKQQNEWARLDVDAGPAASSSPGAVLTRQLRSDALSLRVPTPDLLGRWAERWWGE